MASRVGESVSHDRPAFKVFMCGSAVENSASPEFLASGRVPLFMMKNDRQVDESDREAA